MPNWSTRIDRLVSRDPEGSAAPDVAAGPPQVSSKPLLVPARLWLIITPGPALPSPRLRTTMQWKASLAQRIWIGCLALVLFIAAIAAYVVHRAHRRAAAIAYIESLEESVCFDEQQSWAARLPLPDSLRSVKSVMISPYTPCDLRRLEPLAELEGLCPGELDDEGAKSLSRFRQLSWLDVAGPRVTSAGIAAVSACRQLKLLSLATTSVGDEGLKALRGLPLVHMSLGHTAVTDAGMTELLQVPTLQELFLDDTRITDTGLATLARHPNLTFLILNGTEVTDEGLKELTALPLTILCLERTRVTREGLRAFAGKRGLTITVSSPPFTHADVDALRESSVSIELETQSASAP